MYIGGELYLANLSPVVGSEQGGERPVLILQNDVGNRKSTTTIVAALTANIKKMQLPTHIELSSLDFPLKEDSIILLEQVRTIDKKRLTDRICKLDIKTMRRVDEALKISLGLINF
ncbi:type II toxin-antitoxin system PemK/MazF family toxin (plasmid) [Rossellomorea sp. AcN35-11]|nr:type II toxin-antitoxin system PemK/MazF family toxin [Rossellomorea sp. AcN35-11]